MCGCQDEAYEIGTHIWQLCIQHETISSKLYSKQRCAYSLRIFGNVHEAFTWSAVQKHYKYLFSACVSDGCLCGCRLVSGSKTIKLLITSCKLCSQWKTCAVSDQLYVFQHKNPTKPSTVNKALLNAVEMNLWQIPLLLQTCHKFKKKEEMFVLSVVAHFSLKCDCEVWCCVNSFFLCVCLGLYS